MHWVQDSVEEAAGDDSSVGEAAAEPTRMQPGGPFEAVLAGEVLDFRQMVPGVCDLEAVE